MPAPDPTCTVRRRILHGAAGAVVALTALVGCAGSDDEPAGTDPSPTTANGTASDPTDLPAPGTVVALPPREQEFADAMASAYDPERDRPFTEAHVACLASRWVPVIGVERFEAAGWEPDDVARTGADVSGLGLDQATSDALVAQLPACGVDLRELMLASLTTSVDDDHRRCFTAAVPDETFESAVAASFRGVPGALSDAFEAAAECLLPSEPTASSG